jgi:hypothetical protein
MGNAAGIDMPDAGAPAGAPAAAMPMAGAHDSADSSVDTATTDTIPAADDAGASLSGNDSIAAAHAAAGAGSDSSGAQLGAAPAHAGPGDAAAAANPDGVTNPDSSGAGTDGQGQQAQQQLAPKGTMEYAVQMLMKMAKTGDYSEANEIISEKAKGVAGNIRGNELTEEQIEAYKTAFDLNYLSRKNVGTGIQFTFQNRENKIFTIVVVKEEGVFRIKEVTIRDGKKK